MRKRAQGPLLTVTSCQRSEPMPAELWHQTSLQVPDHHFVGRWRSGCERHRIWSSALRILSYSLECPLLGLLAVRDGHRQMYRVGSQR